MQRLGADVGLALPRLGLALHGRVQHAVAAPCSGDSAPVGLRGAAPSPLLGFTTPTHASRMHGLGRKTAPDLTLTLEPIWEGKGFIFLVNRPNRPKTQLAWAICKKHPNHHKHHPQPAARLGHPSASRWVLLDFHKPP